MRAKRKLLLTTAFAALLGVGVFAGVSSSKESKPAEAVAVGEKVYCKMQYSWWTADSAAIGAYFFNAQSKEAAVSWPGTRMTQESSIDSYTWSINRPSGNYDTVIFVRVNGSGNIADWGAQTNDLTIPTDTKNFYTISSSTAQWSGSGKKVSGSWSNYHSVDPSSTTNSYYLYDPNSVFSSFANIKIYGFGQPETTKPDSWPGQHSRVTSGVQLGVTSMYQIELSESFTKLIVNDGTKQTVDVTASGNTGKVLVIENTTDGEGKYKVHWDNSSVYSNCNTANVYLDAFDWNALYVYTFETVSGNNVEYYGKFPGKQITIKDSNLSYNGGMMQEATIPYYSSGNVRFIYSDGTDSHKSGNLSLTSGSYYWHNGSAWTSNAARGSAAAFVYDLNTARLAVPSSGSVKQYSICGLNAKTWVDRYDGLASVTGAQGYVDAATIYTYKDKSSTGADTTVSFSEIITELRKSAYPNSVKISLLGNITSESGYSITIIVSITAVCLAAVGGYFLFKKKHQ